MAMYINIYRRDLDVGGISAADDTAPEQVIKLN